MKLALEKFHDKIDPERVGVFGWSHGGFSTAWQISHPDFKHLYSVAVLLNPVLNMSYMVSAADFTDWIYSNNLNEDMRYTITAEDNARFFNNSPISAVQNMTVPSLFLIGLRDRRVPPHQSYHYYNILKAKGV